MAEAGEAPEQDGGEKPKGKRKTLFLGAGLMAACAAAAFVAVSMMGGAEPAEAEGGHAEAAAPESHGEDGHGAKGHGAEGGKAPAVAFVPLDPLTVAIGSGLERSHLRFTSQLEVPSARAEEVAALQPRIVDALGGYLRALEPEMLLERDASLRMRGQMLRRVRLVVGPDAVHDLLVTEFVLN